MSNIQIKDGAGVAKYLAASGAGTDSDPFTPQGAIGNAYLDNLPLYQYADTVGDGSGITNMGVDGSTTPVSFKVAPPAGKIYYVARVIASVRDGGTFDSGGWGNNGGSPLPVGINVILNWNSTVVSLTAEKIKSHYDLASVSYDCSHHDWGAGDEFVSFRFTFTKAGQFIKLDGNVGDSLEFVINDDLTYLTDMRVSVQGKQGV